jgi:hypothetical protein
MTSAVRLSQTTPPSTLGGDIVSPPVGRVGCVGLPLTEKLLEHPVESSNPGIMHRTNIVSPNTSRW